MPQCFRCGSTIQTTDVQCKTCGAALKAFGHAGIDLHRATGDQPLCHTCLYHADDSCNYEKRPNAQNCTLYRDQHRPIAEIQRPGARKAGSTHSILLIAAVLLGILLLAIFLH